jgi:hypothetical protein
MKVRMVPVERDDGRTVGQGISSIPSRNWQAGGAQA